MPLRRLTTTPAISLAILAMASPAHSQRAPYGAPITLEQAKRVVVAGQAEASRIGVPTGVAIAVLGSGCQLTLLETQDNANLGVPPVAQDKAYTACAFRVDTKQSQAVLAGGGSGQILLKLRDFTPIEGGKPLVVEGKTIGSVGVSGGSSAQDAAIAEAAAAALSAASR